jgi:hypothetical protein
MGKLHTLRRAIERDPETFTLVGPLLGENRPDGTVALGFRGFVRIPLGATFRDGQWRPARYGDTARPLAYRQFVRKVLLDLGYCLHDSRAF